jgi:hypothetical protein
MKTGNNLWGVLLLTAVVVLVATASMQAQPSGHTTQSGPPGLALTVEPNVIRACDGQPTSVQLLAKATSGSGNALRYRCTVDSGTLKGQGATTTWDLTGARPGTYHAVADVDEGNTDCAAFASVAVIVLDCPPPPPPPPSCPEVKLSCPDRATEKAPVTFTATLSGGTAGIVPTYNWTVGNSHIISGQGSNSITVDTAGLAGQTITATVDVGGYGIPCPASCSVSLPIEEISKKFDEYYDIARNDEKARLDNYAIELQSEPGRQGYIIVYPKRKAKSNEAQARAQRISDYLTNSRGIDASRFTVKIGAARENWLIELWVVPQGAAPPVPQE